VELLVEGGEVVFGGGEVGPVAVGLEAAASFDVEDVEQAAVPEGFAIEADLAAVVEIDGDAPLFEGGKGLRRLA